MSVYSQLGLALSAYDPVIDVSGPSYEPRGRLVDDGLGQKVDSYSHVLNAVGGWWSAQFVVRDTREHVEDWFDRGLNRHIEVYNPGLKKVFEGFVNQVSVTMGTMSATRGPLMNIANRINVTYTPILDATVDPPVTGTQIPTTIAENTDSQDKYGIFEKVISGGMLLDDGTTNEAEQVRDTALAEQAWPETSQSIVLTTSNIPQATISVLGYVHRMEAYVFDDTTAATISVGDQIENVLGNDPMDVLSTDYSKVDANAFLVPEYDNDQSMAWDYLQRLLAVGDASDNRYTFGVYDKRMAVYTVVPTDLAYEHRIMDANMQLLVYGASRKVDPWDVLPARWVFFPDFLTGQAIGTTRADSRRMFIESVAFSAPNSISLVGNKVHTLPQLMAKKGMWS